MDQPSKKIPALAVPRLSQYYRALLDFPGGVVSSEEIAERTGHGAPRIRRDLTYFGQFGRPGRGYDVQRLKKALAGILGIDRTWRVALVGVGNLGAALLGYRGLRRPGFQLVAAFDKDPRKTGQVVEGIPVNSLSAVPRVVRERHVEMALITVPAESAQEVAEVLVKAGVRALLNFAPVRLQPPAGVTIHNIDMAIELERLSFLHRRAAHSGLSAKE